MLISAGRSEQSYLRAIVVSIALTLTTGISAQDPWVKGPMGEFNGDHFAGDPGVISDPWNRGNPWNRFAYGTGTDGSGITWNYNSSHVEQVPNMIGDFFSGFRGRTVGTAGVDRAVAVAHSLGPLAPVPPVGSVVMISVNQTVPFFRAANGASLGVIQPPRTATFTITSAPPFPANTQFPVSAPPAAYTTGAQAILAQIHGPGTIAYDPASSLVIPSPLLLNGFDALYFYNYSVLVDVPTSNAGVGRGGRQKIANGSSPLPQDRVFFHYGFFDDVPLHTSGVDVKRFVPGLEKAFFDGNFSMEVRWPFVASLDNNVTRNAPINTNNAQFDNLATYGKFLLHYQPDFAVSAGLGAALPVAEDFHVRSAIGQELVRVENQSVHLQPFLGMVYTPNERTFAQGFIQYDFDTNGNAVFANSGTGLRHAGRMYDGAFMSVDMGVGYWAHRGPEGSSGLTGFAPMLELHWNNSLSRPSTVNAGPLTIGHFGSNVESFNLTFGSVLEFGPYTNVSAGYVLPMGGDRQHDSGFVIMLDHFPLGR